jgi:mono/diheme cytochrome c family protein
MKRWRGLLSIAALVTLTFVVVMTAGLALPGKPKGDATLEGQPSKVEDFDALYAANCAGCHGDDGRGGATLALNNPAYLAITDDDFLRDVVVRGVARTAMPAFGQAAGGLLTDRQIDVIARGVHTRWAAAAPMAETPPPHDGPDGDAQGGARVFSTFCASCHGSDGSGSAKSASIVDSSYLALVSNQLLRTSLIVGRPEIGQPDWRSDVPGRPLSSQQIADVVAWLAAHRAPFPGRPYPASR